jgi:hypothetical protein
MEWNDAISNGRGSGGREGKFTGDRQAEARNVRMESRPLMGAKRRRTEGKCPREIREVQRKE